MITRTGGTATTINEGAIPAIITATIAISLCAAALLISTGVQAQDSPRRGASAVLMEEIVVTARKREEDGQEVPLSISAFNSGQLEALKVRDLTNLSVGMPNVSLEDVGTTRGTANFSIRGLGINSSIPSIDPTVGVFVNGVYMGVNNGIVFDMFDMENVQVLRGPQGTLFGRNVTGGAVLLTTKKPSDELEASARVAFDQGDEGGLNSYVMGAIGGPLATNLGARLVVYLNDDEGKFENDLDGKDFGEIEQLMMRGTVMWTPNDVTQLLVRYEVSTTDGEGPAAQSHTNGSGVDGTPVNNSRDSFNFSIDERGYQDTKTEFITAELNWDVGFGDGTITNIIGYRDYESDSKSDIDAQPEFRFHAPAWLEATQVSNELRYNGFFADKANVTAGVFYFDNDLDYHERRELQNRPPVTIAVQQNGGGEYEVESYSVFAALDYALNDFWTFTAGVNYSHEKKAAKITSLASQDCNIVDGPACTFDFTDRKTWENIAPKLGASYYISADQSLYSHWTRGYRSGGYNLRNTSTDPDDKPGPFDEEEVDNFEIGYKSSNPWGRLNAAVFYNQIADMQREVNLPSMTAGVVQLVRNTADANIFGAEIDGTFSLTDTLVMLASVGYIDAEYDTVKFDLNGDGDVNASDEALDLPRAAEWTYSLGFAHDYEMGTGGLLTSRVNYAYRDDFAYTDSNLGFVEEVEIVDAGLDYLSNEGHWVFSIYGRNLLDEVSFGGDTQLPSPFLTAGDDLGGTFSPLSAGRRYGVEVTYNYF